VNIAKAFKIHLLGGCSAIVPKTVLSVLLFPVETKKKKKKNLNRSIIRAFLIFNGGWGWGVAVGEYDKMGTKRGVNPRTIARLHCVL
jgi:hypothetical protein